MLFATVIVTLAPSDPEVKRDGNDHEHLDFSAITQS